MMGGWLARLKNGKAPDTAATKPTKPPQRDEKVGFVGFVAYSPASFQKVGEGDPSAAAPLGKFEKSLILQDSAANDSGTLGPALATDLDCWCWPHSVAMNSGEVNTFTARVAKFTDKGVSFADAEQLANKLMSRDREGDDRRVCVECSSLCWSGSWHCGNSKKAGLRVRHLPKDFVLMFQRCDGFCVAGFENFQMISGKRKF